uniref:Uncharacterized protein n=1 Tax=Trichogramma kaykai TaxID=54128 RepID=A0ABD2X454_9HYME
MSLLLLLLQRPEATAAATSQSETQTTRTTTSDNVGGGESCGGHLTARRGVLSTPNFPGRFSTPIQCRWLLDASDLADRPNASIVVYLTQLYAFRGLRFHEYAYYENEATNFGGALLREIDEAGVFEIGTVRTYRPYLLVDFRLERLEGNHVRVLDRLLDVYGFNLTYEMTDDVAPKESCTLSNCSFTGNCFLASDRATFYCDCFEGFGGEHCSHGPLCVTERGNPICQNGGTCRHVGAAAVRCSCPPQFSGDFCEISSAVAGNEGKGCNSAANCIYQCPISRDQAQQQPCQCKEPSHVDTDRTRFECRIKLTNVSHPRGVDFVERNNVSLEAQLIKQLSKYLEEFDIATLRDLQISSITADLEVNFYLTGELRDEEKIQGALKQLVQRRRLGSLFLEPTHLALQQKSALRLQSLRINQVNERQVQLGDQFSLSCVAVGSSDLKFFWYKDDMLINMSKATREIWYRHLPNDGSDYHTSILTVNKAVLLDKGLYTCQVIDRTVQQCKSIHIDIKDEPNVKVLPMSSTIEKGSTIRLMCMTPNMQNVGIGFGWSKNRALLRLEPGQEVWEDLYPAGSLLTLSNARHTAVYSCNVAHRSASVRVDAVNSSLVPLCPAERLWNRDWPSAAPGSKAILSCPLGFVGRHVTRLCSMRSSNLSEWDVPNFEACFYEPLVQPYNQFRSLTLGYESTNGSSTIQAIWDVLQYRRSPLYPGEGDRIISLLQEVEHYQYNIDELSDLKNSAEATLRILDKILNNAYSIVSKQKLVMLNQIVFHTLEYWSENIRESGQYLSLGELFVQVLPMKVYTNSVIMYSMKIPRNEQERYHTWNNDRVTIRLYHNNQKISNNTVAGMVAVYRNLIQFFPSTYVTELKDGTDLEYRLSSRVVSVSISHRNLSRKDRFEIDLEFGEIRHNVSDSQFWNMSCAALGPGGDWNLDACKLVTDSFENSGCCRCICFSPGTFATFVTMRSDKVASTQNASRNFIVIVGCGSCLLQCSISLVVIMAFWWHNRTWLNFLKIQCCVAILAAMATFIYALHLDVPKDNLSIVAMSLETFLLMSISSPISQALIIYAEISNFHPSQQLQPMVIAVITGVPILAILSTELTRKTIGWNHESWWIIFGTGAYNIFVMCSIALLLTFLLLYIAIIQKTKNLLKNFSKKDVFKVRIKMLHCSALVIFGIVTMEISSIVYINSSSIIYHYIFAFHSALLGFIILMVYVACSDVLIMTPSLKKLKRHMESENDVSTEHHTKDRELSSSSASAVTQLPAGTTYLLAGVCEPVAVYPEARGVAVGIDARDYSGGEVGSTYTPHIGLPEIQIHRVDERYLENVTASGSNCASVRTNTDSYTLGGKQRCDVTAQTESQAFFGSLAMPPAPEPYATVLPEPTRKDMSSLPSLQQCNIINSQHRHHQHHQHYQHQHHHHHQHHQYPSVELHQLHQHQPRQASSKLGSQGLQSIMKHHHLPSQTSQHQQMQQQMHIETCLAMPDVTLAINGPEVAELLSKKQPLFIVPAPDESLYIQQVPGTTDESSEVPEKMPDIANMNERKQPDGEAKVVLVKPEIVIEECVVVGSSDLHHIHQPNGNSH